MIVKLTHRAFKVKTSILVSNVVIDFYIMIFSPVNFFSLKKPKQNMPMHLIDFPHPTHTSLNIIWDGILKLSSAVRLKTLWFMLTLVLMDYAVFLPSRWELAQ